MDESRVVIVTGGSKGIGKGIALRQSVSGDRVAIAARSPSELEQSRKEIEELTGGEVLGIPTDMRRQEDIERLRATVLDRWGRIDVLVNSAGSAPYGYLLDLSDADWDTAFDVKFYGAVWATRAVLPTMIDQGSGVVVHVAGKGGKQVSPTHMAGGAVNAALMHFSKALAMQYGPDGIRSNCVSPGLTNTDRWRYTVSTRAAKEGIDESEWAQQAIQGIPLQRIAEPEDVAEVVHFLASDASKHVSGSHVLVDGGATTAL